MRFTLPFLIALSACAQFPELDGTIAPELENAPFPDLVPLAPLFAQADATSNNAPDVEAALTPRLAALIARAARLRGPVLSTAERARLTRGVR